MSPAGDDIAISSKKNQALLAILALAQGEAVTRSRLIGILWAERGEDQARSSLRQGFTALRKALGACGPFSLRVDDEEAAIDLDAIRVDTLRFAGAGGGQAPEALERALALDPTNPPANLEVARLYAGHGEVERAGQHVEAVLRRVPNHAGALELKKRLG